jgi:hypothetical protein
MLVRLRFVDNGSNPRTILQSLPKLRLGGRGRSLDGGDGCAKNPQSLVDATQDMHRGIPEEQHKRYKDDD